MWEKNRAKYKSLLHLLGEFYMRKIEKVENIYFKYINNYISNEVDPNFFYNLTSNPIKFQFLLTISETIRFQYICIKNVLQKLRWLFNSIIILQNLFNKLKNYIVSLPWNIVSSQHSVAYIKSQRKFSLKSCFFLQIQDTYLCIFIGVIIPHRNISQYVSNTNLTF